MANKERQAAADEYFGEDTAKAVAFLEELPYSRIPDWEDVRLVISLAKDLQVSRVFVSTEEGKAEWISRRWLTWSLLPLGETCETGPWMVTENDETGVLVGIRFPDTRLDPLYKTGAVVMENVDKIPLPWAVMGIE